MVVNEFADIDECFLNSSLCEQICTNTDGGYVCSCMVGYQLVSETNQCEGQLTLHCVVIGDIGTKSKSLYYIIYIATHF